MNITVLLSRDENIKHYNADKVTLDIEEYLKGVVGSEIGNAHIEACKAQAVAARTFAITHMSSSGEITDQSSKHQAFRASRISSSYANALQAVEETAGQVLYYNGKICATCVYSSSNGGRIKSSQERWGGVRGYLISKDDPYDTGSGNGHGVGMSQNGAKNMAAQGFSYREILQFYYPGTEIKEGYGTMGTNAETVRKWCLSKVGCGYVWGATGQKLTQSALEALYNRHPNDVDKDLCWRLWANKVVYDCAGFAAEAMRQVGFSITAGATSAWNSTKWAQKGSIDTLPKDKVCCLFRTSTKDPSKKQHMGVYLGDGTFIDSRGTKSGVIGPNKLGSYAWTDWAIPPQLINDSVDGNVEPEVIKVAYQAKVTAQSGSTVNMRASTSTSSAVVTKIAIGQIVDVIEVAGDWSKIMWNNKTGYMMSKYLEKVGGSGSSTVWYVRLECDSEAQAKAIASILAKAKATT